MHLIPRPRTPAIIAALAAISVLAAACGSSAATPTLAPGVTAAPTTAATAGSSIAPTSGQPTDVPGSGGPGGVDLGDLAGALDGVDSYRMTVTSGGEVSYMATYVRNPVESQAIEMSGAKIIIIGNEAWLDQGSGGYQSVPVEMVNGLTGAFSPIMLFGAYGQMGALGGLTDLGTESKNGVNAHHYRIDSSTPIIGVGLPAGASVDIWVAEAGYLVSFVSVSGDSSSDVTIDVTNVNDPSNTVERP